MPFKFFRGKKMKSLKITATLLSVLAISFAALSASAWPGDRDRGGHRDDRGRGGWDRGYDRGPGRGGPGGGWDRGPGHGGGHHGGGWGRQQWQAAGTSCGPQQPWGVSMMCPNTSPNGGPMGMNCDNVPRGTRCYGASWWQNGFNCTNPYNGQGSYGSFIFNMYVCN